MSRTWMIHLGSLVLLLLAGSEADADHAEPPRNVLVIVSDDHRADVLGCAGHPIVQTPNIDRLASDGVRFENAFAQTSICAASRASILTGLPERSHHYTFGRPPLDRELAESSYPARLREQRSHHATIPQLPTRPHSFLQGWRTMHRCRAASK